MRRVNVSRSLSKGSIQHFHNLVLLFHKFELMYLHK